MSTVEADFTDTVATNISDSFNGKIIRTYVLGRSEPGHFRHEPRIMLAQYLYSNWACEIPLSQIGYDQQFDGMQDLVIKFKENNATPVGGQTGRNDFYDATMFIGEIPYHTRIDIFIIGRINTPDEEPQELSKIKLWIEDFIKKRPLGMASEGFQNMYLVEGHYAYPEQRDKNTFKTSVSVIVKYTIVYR
jgi:hypothetical protein